jgi:restriction system protein
MSKNKKPGHEPLGAVIDLFALLPWWACLLAALGAFITLHQITQDYWPLMPTGKITGANALEPPLNALGYYAVQAAKILITTVLLAASGLSYLARAKRRQLLERAHAMRTLDEMSWQEFELLVGEAFRLKGFSVKELGGNGPDGGVDLVLHKNGQKHLVQCKQWKTYVVGVDVARQIFGVMAAQGAASCYVVTSGRFTQAAMQFAKGQKITLIDGRMLMDMIAEVQKSKSQVINQPQATAPLQAHPSTVHSTNSSRPPPCPACQTPMVKRSSRRGGAPFWGCTSYPSCRGTRKISC